VAVLLLLGAFGVGISMISVWNKIAASSLRSSRWNCKAIHTIWGWFSASPAAAATA